MPDDPRFSKFLDEWEGDRAAGRTVTNLHRNVGSLREWAQKHDREDDERFGKLAGDVGRLREGLAHERGRSEGREEGTGRHRALGDFDVHTPVQAIPVQVVPVIEKRKNSVPPWIRRAFDSVLAKVLLLVAAAVAGAVIRHVWPQDPPAVASPAR
jgi:hypothetical protein